MAEKLRNPEFPDSMTDPGWFIPTDYVLIKPMFRADLLRMYVGPLARGSAVLDFNAGTQGLGPDVVAAGHDYHALEQNERIRDALSRQSLGSADWRPPRIPRPDASVDLCLSLAFLEHLPGWIDAFQLLLEVRRVLKPGGRLLIVAPNAPGMGATFWIDYKHGWIVSKQRLIDMAVDAGFEVVGARYSLGWITLRQGPLWAVARACTRLANAVLNLPVVRRPLEAVGLGVLVSKVQKTVFELVAVEVGKPEDD